MEPDPQVGFEVYFTRGIHAVAGNHVKKMAGKVIDSGRDVTTAV